MLVRGAAVGTAQPAHVHVVEVSRRPRVAALGERRGQLAHRRHHLAHAAHRRVVRPGVPGLVQPPHPGPETQDEAPARQLVQVQGLEGHHHRAAGEGQGDARAELDPLGGGGRHGERHGGGAVQLRRPEAGDAGALGRAREVREPGGVVAQERDVHRYPERSGHCASIPAVAPHRPPRHRAPHVRCGAGRDRPGRAPRGPGVRRPLGGPGPGPLRRGGRPGGRHQRLEHPLDARPRAAQGGGRRGRSSRRTRPSAGRSWCSCCRWCS